MPVGLWISRTAEEVLFTCCPPAPLICLVPAVSPFTCPYRSTSTALLMETKLSMAAMVRMSLV